MYSCVAVVVIRVRVSWLGSEILIIFHQSIVSKPMLEMHKSPVVVGKRIIVGDRVDAVRCVRKSEKSGVWKLTGGAPSKIPKEGQSQDIFEGLLIKG